MNHILLILTLLLGTPNAKVNDNKMLIVAPFIPKGAHVCDRNTVDIPTGKILSSEPLIFTGALLDSKSRNLIVAYSDQPNPNCKGVQILILQHDLNKWRAIKTLSYEGKYLWVEGGVTVGLRLLRLPGSVEDSLQIITAQGAALGAGIEILRWNVAKGGFDNLMPRDAEGYEFRVSPGSVKVGVQSERIGTGSFITYVYNGKNFARQRNSH